MPIVDFSKVSDNNPACKHNFETGHMIELDYHMVTLLNNVTPEILYEEQFCYQCGETRQIETIRAADGSVKTGQWIGCVWE